MSDTLLKIQDDLYRASLGVGDAIHLLNYLQEDMEREVYAPAKEGKGGLIRYQRIEMMFTLLWAALCKLQDVVDTQSDLFSRLDRMRAEKEKVSAGVGAPSKDNKKSSTVSL